MIVVLVVLAMLLLLRWPSFWDRSVTGLITLADDTLVRSA